MNAPLLKADKLTKQYKLQGRPINALQDFSFTIFSGETIGLIGESGSGKSTAGKLLLRLEDPSAGQIFYKGTEITNFTRKQMLPFRKKMQIIFQDPFASLNPRMLVGDIIAEPLEIHHLHLNQKEDRVSELLQQVGLPSDAARRYPHEFSGGQRQRIAIARALAVEPEFIVCDEPISALDLSIQAQIVNLLKDLQQELGLAYLFIAHDLAMVKYLSHRVAVLYRGSVVEFGPSDELFSNPQHPYTQALIDAIPHIGKPSQVFLEGEIPNTTAAQPTGCPFYSRCPKATSICKQEEPPLITIGQQQVKCHLHKF